MNMTKDYTMVQGKDVTSLTKRVQEELTNGYTPFGNPISHGGFLVQALILITGYEELQEALQKEMTQ